MGTQANPIQAGYSAVLEFQRAANRSVFESGNDYQSLSFGLLSMGTLNLYGSEITPYVASASPLTVGTTSIRLASAPVGWHVGDTLLCPGTAPETFDSGGRASTPPNQDEQIQIAAISGNTVTLAAPLKYSHDAAPDTQFLIADETRNVTIETAAGTAPDQQAHVMQMHNDAAAVGYAAFDNLGRTDKSIPLNNGSATTGAGTNEIGRYALHFHRDAYPGLTDKAPPIEVIGCFEMGSPGWGYVNHSSNVDFEQDVAYNNFGAGFVTQSGDEIGTFNQCYAVRATGVAPPSGALNGFNHFTSLGIDGEGFWIQSPAVAVTNDVATDCRIGFAEWDLGLTETGLGVAQLYIPWLQNAGLYPHTQGNRIGVNEVPIASFSANTASFASIGFDLTWTTQVDPSNQSSTISNLVASDVADGLFGGYFAFHVQLQNSTFLAYAREPTYAPAPGGTDYFGVKTSPGYSLDWNLTNLDVENFTVGALPGAQGNSVIQGGYYNNPTNFYIYNNASGVQYTFNNVNFGPNSVLNYDLFTTTTAFGYEPFFLPAQVFIDGKELYWADEAPSAVVFPTGNAGIPPQLVGLTAQQIYDQYGIAPQGLLAPADTVPMPGSNGLIGSVETQSYAITLQSAESAPTSKPYKLRYIDWVSGKPTYFTDPTPISLQLGWDAFVEIINGHKTTFFTHGTEPAPGTVTA
jgi:hypothetical protein